MPTKRIKSHFERPQGTLSLCRGRRRAESPLGIAPQGGGDAPVPGRRALFMPCSAGSLLRRCLCYLFFCHVLVTFSLLPCFGCCRFASIVFRHIRGSGVTCCHSIVLLRDTTLVPWMVHVDADVSEVWHWSASGLMRLSARWLLTRPDVKQN